MITYLVGLAAVVIVYSLFMACWLESKETPPMRADVPVKQATASSNWSDAIVAIAAVVALVIYATQAYYMRQANKTTSAQLAMIQSQVDLMKVDQRAWLSIVGPRCKPLEEGKPFDFLVEVRNSGRTPAVIKVASVNPSLVSSGVGALSLRTAVDDLSIAIKPNHVLGDDLPLDSLRLHPGGFTLLSPTNRSEFSKEQIQEIMSGRLLLCVTVRVRYAIIGGEDDIERVHFVYQPEVGQFSIDPRQTFIGRSDLP